MEESKECSKCQRLLPHSAFNRNRSHGDGLQSYCKECSNKLASERYHSDEQARLRRQKRYKQRHIKISLYPTDSYYVDEELMDDEFFS